MVNDQDARMDAVFQALSDPTRRSMVRRLARGPATVGELGRPFAISKPAVTKHVRILERADLLRRERRGRVHRCTLNPGPMHHASAWIEHHRRFWEASLDRLAHHVEQPETSNGDTT